MVFPVPFLYVVGQQPGKRVTDKVLPEKNHKFHHWMCHKAMKIMSFYLISTHLIFAEIF